MHDQTSLLVGSIGMKPQELLKTGVTWELYMCNPDDNRHGRVQANTL